MSEPKRDREDEASPETVPGAGNPARTLVRPRSQRVRSADTLASSGGGKSQPQVPARSQVELPAAMGARYEVRALAGEGGMGEVFVVHDKVLERDVALKRLRGEHHGEDRLRRFVQEARVTGRLEHPNIVPVHELSEGDDQHFFTMKLVRGCSLGQVLARLRKCEAAAVSEYELRRLVGILVSVCQAVAFAHSKGVLHRDLKPDNIMLGDFGEVVVMDWGLARDAHGPGARTEASEGIAGQSNLEAGASGPRPHALASLGLARDVHGPGARTEDLGSVAGQPGLDAAASGSRPSASASAQLEPAPAAGGSGGGMGTMEGSIAGTPGYMAPEQARGEISRLSERSDVYALGAILYECLTLSPPHQKENSLLTLQAVLKEPIETPSRRDPRRRIPRDLEAVAMRALAREPHRRYPSVNSLRADLECWLADRPVTARRPGGLERLVLWGKRNRELALGACLGMAVAMTSGLAVWGRAAWIESRDMAVKEKQVEDYLAQAEAEAVALAAEPTEQALEPAPEQDVRPAPGPASPSEVSQGAIAAPSAGDAGASLALRRPAAQKSDTDPAPMGLSNSPPASPARAQAAHAGNQADPVRQEPAASQVPDRLDETTDPDDRLAPGTDEAANATSGGEVPGDRPARTAGETDSFPPSRPEEGQEHLRKKQGRLASAPEEGLEDDVSASVAPETEPASSLESPGASPAPAPAAPMASTQPVPPPPPAPTADAQPSLPPPPAPAEPQKRKDERETATPSNVAPPSPAAAPIRLARAPSPASGRRRVAMRFYELALQKAPDNAKARTGLAGLLVAEAQEQLTLPGKRDEAEKMARRAAELDAGLTDQVARLLAQPH